MGIEIEHGLRGDIADQEWNAYARKEKNNAAADARSTKRSGVWGNTHRAVIAVPLSQTVREGTQVALRTNHSDEEDVQENQEHFFFSILEEERHHWCEVERA